jgi:hypothetical protein
MYFRLLVNLSLSLFLLAACNEEKKEFMTPKSDEPVLDVNIDEYSLNGNVLGKTQDVFLSDDIRIVPLDSEFEKMRPQFYEKNVNLRIRFSEDVYYSVFYKILMTAAFWGIQPVRYTIGPNSSKVYTFDIREKLRNLEWKDEWANSCFGILVERSELISVLESDNNDVFPNQELINDSFYRSSKLECTHNYMNLSVLFPVKHSDSKYRVAFYETDSILPKVYDLKGEADLLNLLESVRKDENLQTKKDKDLINIFVRDSVGEVMTLDKVEPLIKSAAKVDYRMNFSHIVDGGLLDAQSF